MKKIKWFYTVLLTVVVSGLLFGPLLIHNKDIRVIWGMIIQFLP